MDLNEIKQLIRLVDEKQFAEFELERGDFKLRIKRTETPIVQFPAAAPGTMTMAASGSAASHAMTEGSGHAQQPVLATPSETSGAVTDADVHVVMSPIVGTFYRAPSPASSPFVQVGDRIQLGTILCIVEAMKLMNEIPSDAAGEVVNIFVENGQPVEYGQPLFGIKT